MGACLGLLLATSACTPERDQSELFAPQDIGILVVDAVLVVDESNPLVRLSKTLAPDVPFTQEAAGVVGAVTYIQNLTTEAVFTYLDLPGEPGIYYSESAFTVAPETEYELWVRTAEGEILSARTLTPARFQVDEWVLLDPTGTTELRQLKTFADAGDSVYYQPENQIKYAEGLIQARFATGGAEVFAGVGYQVALFSIDPDADYVIDPPFFEEEDFEDLPTEGSWTRRSSGSMAVSACSVRPRPTWGAFTFCPRSDHRFGIVNRAQGRMACDDFSPSYACWRPVAARAPFFLGVTSRQDRQNQGKSANDPHDFSSLSHPSRYNPAPGPSGQPASSQTTSSSIQPRVNAMV
jgi:hypothetical protein